MPADATMKVATVQETVTVTAEAPSPLNTTQVGANIKQDVVDTPGHRADAPGRGAAGSRAHRQHPERGSGHDRGQLRLRQRVPARRRRHQRQPVRKREQPLHRGRDRGDPGPDLGDLGRVRPLQRRRHQRHHQAGRQPVLGQLPRELHQPLVARRDAVSRRDAGDRARRTSSASSTRRPSAGRSSRTGSGSSRPAGRRPATPSPRRQRAGSPSPRSATRSGARSSCPARSTPTTRSRRPIPR